MLSDPRPPSDTGLTRAQLLRTAVGMAALPFNASVEIDAIVEIDV